MSIWKSLLRTVRPGAEAPVPAAVREPRSWSGDSDDVPTGGASKRPAPASDEDLLRETLVLARRAAARGDRPFGALLFHSALGVLARAENRVATDSQPLAHAELNLLKGIAAWLPAPVLGSCTLYASAEPCAMCAAAIAACGIGRVVYGLSAERVREVAGSAPEISTLGCREVLASTRRSVAVLGPMLEEECLEPFLPDQDEDSPR